MEFQEMENTSGYTILSEVVKQGRGRKSVNIPMETANQILESYENLLDIIAFDEAKKKNEEFFPSELVDRLIERENKLKVFREYRGLTQQKLASLSGVSRDMIAMIETGKKNGSLTTVKKLAKALNLDMEDLT